MQTIQFGYEAPAKYDLFSKWLSGTITQNWFPWSDEKDVAGSYDRYRRMVRSGQKVKKQQRTLKRNYRIDRDRWVVDMVKLGRLEQKKKGTCNVFKALLLKKYERLPVGWYNIKINGAGQSPTHIARFNITEDDIRSRQKIIYKINLILPELPSYRPLKGYVTGRATTMRDIFENDLFNMFNKIFS